MANNTKTKGIINALCFLSALLTLIFNQFGLLTIPGLIIAVLAIYFSFTNRFSYSAVLGITTATLSFIAQYITVFCLGCTLAAASFALGGLLSLLFLHSENMLLNISLLILLTIGLVFMVCNLPKHYQTPVITQQVVEMETEPDKAKLYISTECNGCASVIGDFIQADSKGQYWQPIIVPHMFLARGEAMLKDRGYKGNIKSASQSPTGFVPLLQVDNQYYQGKDITPEKIERR